MKGALINSTRPAAADYDMSYHINCLAPSTNTSETGPEYTSVQLKQASNLKSRR